MKKNLVISAINFSTGGPLKILQDAVHTARETLGNEWNITVMVHRKGVLNLAGVTVKEFPLSKRNWLVRIWYEWFVFQSLSKEMTVDLWVSLHDITPRVVARRQVVYCHNPAPFYSVSFREAWMDPSFFLFNKLYSILYRTFIERNHCVVVQQEWLRCAFAKWVAPSKIVVAYPEARLPALPQSIDFENEKTVFLYPALPRVFKNFEVICEAVDILIHDGLGAHFEVRLTVNGTENRYARWLLEKYSRLGSIRFLGLQTRDQIEQQYREAEVVLFPSKLETWGLPISEAKFFRRKLLIADLPYAREAVGCYDNLGFFDPHVPRSLADQMRAIVERRWMPVSTDAQVPVQPFARNWAELWGVMTVGL